MPPSISCIKSRRGRSSLKDKEQEYVQIRKLRVSLYTLEPFNRPCNKVGTYIKESVFPFADINK
jgi:hypothetical protein